MTAGVARVHVTGGSGFTGKFVLRELRSRGIETWALARTDRAAEAITANGATPVDGDLDRPESLAPAFRTGGADALLNIASLGFGHAPSIVQAASEAGIRRAVFVSTTALFTRLNAPSKAVRGAGEDTVRAADLDWTIVRPTMIYGTPDDRNLVRLLQLMRRTSILPIPGGGRRLQQPIHVADLAKVLVDALLEPRAIRKAYNVAGPEPLTLRTIVELSGAAVGVTPRIVPVPLTPVRAALGMYERVASRPKLKAEQIDRLSEDKAFDITAACQDLGFAPRPFEVGIRAEAEMLAATS